MVERDRPLPLWFGFSRPEGRSRCGHWGLGRSISCRVKAPIELIEASRRRWRPAPCVSIVRPACVHSVVPAQIRTGIDVETSTVGVIADIGSVVPAIKALPPPMSRRAAMIQVVSSELSRIGIRKVSIIVAHGRRSVARVGLVNNRRAGASVGFSIASSQGSFGPVSLTTP